MPPLPKFLFRAATVQDTPALAALHTAVAEHLTNKHGRGPWSSKTTEKGASYSLRTSRVFVALEGTEVVGTLRLTEAPKRTFSLWGLVVTRGPLKARQNLGIGRRCLEKAKQAARAWPADAIRLDAYDADAGAGPFYARCGMVEIGRAKYRNAPLVYFELLLS